MRLVLLVAAIAAACLMLVVQPVVAEVVVFGNSPVDGSGCGISDFQSSQQESDTFVLSQGQSSFNSVRWWGAYGANPDPSPSDDFTIRFFSDLGGAPATSSFAEYQGLSVTRTATSMQAGPWVEHDGGTVYQYSAYIPTLSLTAGSNYYMSIVNNTGSAWGWMEDSVGGHWYRYDDLSPWTISDRNSKLSFTLAYVPEPSSVLAILFGIGSLGGMRLFRKR